ncbi:hypothetical protein [Acinetobacter haemolyticus]|uniref:hypothetical protein n=1 Tax=Acinetobacter haemolyticus TaxID=29430 RepID=UPI000F740D43|nr:hypothetical protein [Acinetobacter haemolyticus]RSN77046.1 hypothetical protein EA769_05940 [Acinetobacter haemolyticus]
MHSFLKIAENIYEKIEKELGFTENPIEDLNNLMIALRSEVKGSNFKMLYNYINFDDLLMKSEGLTLDISLIPKSKNKSEYILWLTGFIGKLLVVIKNDEDEDETKDFIITPKYYFDDLGNIVLSKEKNTKERSSDFYSVDLVE